MLTSEDYHLLIDRFDRSAARLRLIDADAVVERYLDPEHAVFPAEHMGDRLRELLAADDARRFSTHEVRKGVAARVIGSAIGGSRLWADEWHHLAGYFGGGTALRPPAEDAWDEAADLSRALFILQGHAIDQEELRWSRELATAQAAGRLKVAGVGVTMTGPELTMPPAALEQATALIHRHFGLLGFVDVISNLFPKMRDAGLCIDRMYVAGRRPEVMRTVPSTPWNLLLQLAARSSALGTLPRRDPARGVELDTAVLLATDLTTVLEVEPHGYQAIMERRPERMIPMLQELALFDALFSFRQWPLRHTPFILSAFYNGVDDAAMRQAAGWGLADAMALVEAVEAVAKEDPAVFRQSDLVSAGANAATLPSLLADMAWQAGTMNAEMISPLGQSDLMFRPLVAVADGQWTQIASSLAAPAFYEAIQVRVREALSKSAVAELSGNGTERVVSALFARAGLTPFVEGRKYDMGGGDDGECDLVFADDERILFVEAKAKPVSRLTQAGVGHAALLDFAGGMLAAQLQGIGHERVLCSHGRIDFEGGASLPLAGRSVYRLSVTLLDHAGLHDRLLVRGMLRLFLGSEFDTVDGVDQRTRKQVSKLNTTLRKAAADLTVLDGMGFGENSLHRGGSVNAGQLAIVLEDAKATRPVSLLAEVVARIAPPHTYGLFNPLSEYLLWRESPAGLI
ncbi:hypothetical protein GCM10023115_00320 [Pontixanthobacter gangjinensis]|uniref:Uncharacterized protein n=1 Tax=Pontixanthobacter gangjinensis TaxID=1028742 RepID=A0A6I4SI91_9SPHN|nr:hypothetical protein [Pontixanthobacter gangjinensis]MXO55283.1 hypothetical protein [Pontixanthobacter gangjinensis]